MGRRRTASKHVPFLHIKRISFIGVFGVNALSQTLVGGWLASRDLKAFSVFALITGLGNLLAFLDFGAGTIVQTNYIGYLRDGSLKSFLFVKFALKQSLVVSVLICQIATVLLIVNESYFLNLAAIYLIFLGLTIMTNLAINLIYAVGKSEVALLLSRSSWFWTLLITLIFRGYFEDHLYQVSLIAVASQFLCGLLAVVFCIVKQLLKPSTQIRVIDRSTKNSYLRDYRTLALTTGLAGIPLMVSLYADRYIVSYVNGPSSILSLAAYGTIFSGTVGILNFLYYKKRAEIDYSSSMNVNYKIISFLKLVPIICIVYFVFGQLTIHFFYPEKISNLYIHFFYSLGLICIGLSLGLQLRSVSISYQRVIAQSVFWQALANIALTFTLAHFIGGIAGPLSTTLAILFVQLPILHARSPMQ
jgi:hypothetical protein